MFKASLNFALQCIYFFSIMKFVPFHLYYNWYITIYKLFIMNKFTSWHEFSDILVNVPLPQLCGATDVSDGEWDIELRFKLINHITGSLFFYVIGFFFPSCLLGLGTCFWFSFIVLIKLFSLWRLSGSLKFFFPWYKT